MKTNKQIKITAAYYKGIKAAMEGQYKNTYKDTELFFSYDLGYKITSSPKVGDICNQTYDGRLAKAKVIAVNTDDTFDVVMSFGATMHNIPFNKFNKVC